MVGLGKKMLEIQGDMNRLDDVMKYREDPWLTQDNSVLDQNAIVTSKLSGKIELSNISFGYNLSGGVAALGSSRCWIDTLQRTGPR